MIICVTLHNEKCILTGTCSQILQNPVALSKIMHVAFKINLPRLKSTKIMKHLFS